tara:strand:+ start:1040 stop:1348 length:309 start_codon:yes stop_codon:yes gene_type:complete
MAKKYVNITSAPTTTTLLSNADKQQTGKIKSINISNNRGNTHATISLYLDSNSTSDDYYFFKNVFLPPGTSLFLNEGLSFDINNYALKFTNADSNDISIIIK